MSKERTVLVTGGAGYIGSVLVPQLLRSRCKVTVLDNFMYGQASLLDVCHHPNLSIIAGDVRDKNLFKEQVCRNETIIPLAAIVGGPACNKDQPLATQVNQEQAADIAEWTSNEQRVLAPITNSGYGIGQKGIYCDEKSPLKPISHYGKTKVKAEQILLDRGNAVTFRLATVFGVAPRMRMDLLVNDFVYRAYNDRSIVLFESHFKRNYIHIRDIANVFLFGMENYEKLKGEPFNVGLSDANLSKKELCDKIKEYLPDFHILESEIGKDPDQRDYIVSNEKIESAGWAPQYNLDQGIQELVKAYSYLKVNPFLNM